MIVQQRHNKSPNKESPNDKSLTVNVLILLGLNQPKPNQA